MKTYGYDYAYAVSWKKINEALIANAAGKAINLGYNGTDKQTNTSIAITLSPKPYQIVGGGGNSKIHLQINMDQGFMELDGPVINGSYDLSGVSLIVEVSLGWVETAGATLQSDCSGAATSLICAPTQSTDKTAPGYVSAVNVLDPNGQLNDPSGQPDTVAIGLLKTFSVQNLIKNREKLAYIFADVMPTPSNPNSWLKPTSWDYFNVADKGAAQQSLCFLCMLGDDPLPSTGAAFDATNLSADHDTVILISQPTLFKYALLPAIKSSFSGGGFKMSCSDETCTIKNTSGFDVGKVETSDFNLVVDDAGTGLAISASGGGSLEFLFGLAKLPGASYSWSTASNNPLKFAKGTISFTADKHPSIHHNQTIHWYDWVLLVAVGITNAASLSEAIYHAINGFSDASESMGVDNINKALGDAFGSGVLNLSKLIDWKLSGQSLSLTTAGLDGPLFTRGDFQ